MSSITVISTPAEIYYYGIMFLWFGLSYLFVAVFVSYVYMPFFYSQGRHWKQPNLPLICTMLLWRWPWEWPPSSVDLEYRHGYTSSYKYIEERFGRTLKIVLCVIYTVNTVIYAGIGEFNTCICRLNPTSMLNYKNTFETRLISRPDNLETG